MKKLFGRVNICLFMVLLLSSQTVYCTEQDPEKCITEFYTWYIPRLDATNNKEIYRYVTQDTLEGIKTIPNRPGYDRTDYFLKLSNFPSDMNGVSISVDQVEVIGPDTLVAIVTIASVDKSKHSFPDSIIVVVLKKIKGKLKIFKCIDTYPEA